MAERTAIIGSRVGLHARPAAIFAEAVGELPVEVTIALETEPAEDALDASAFCRSWAWAPNTAPRLCCAPRAKAPKRRWINW